MYRMVLFASLCMALIFAGCNATAGKREAEHACASCHGAEVSNVKASAHGELSCDTCHGRLENHLERPKIRPATELNANSCITCHDGQHKEWAVSPHGLIATNFSPNNLSKMKKSAHPAFPKPSYGESEQVTCVYCHNPCKPNDKQMTRLPKAELCFACHGGKWYHNTLTATQSQPYPDKGYAAFANHPHNSGSRCITCHMARTPGAELTGGHTLAMRSAAGLLNLDACAACHDAAATFDINNKQTAVCQALDSLQKALEERNNGTLPAGTAGTCSQCKRGNEPFDHDPEMVLDHAYQSYLQIAGDKSLGVHNPGFALQVLRDALESVETQYKR